MLGTKKHSYVDSFHFPRMRTFFATRVSRVCFCKGCGIFPVPEKNGNALQIQNGSRLLPTPRDRGSPWLHSALLPILDIVPRRSERIKREEKGIFRYRFIPITFLFSSPNDESFFVLVVGVHCLVSLNSSLLPFFVALVPMNSIRLPGGRKKGNPANDIFIWVTTTTNLSPYYCS